MKILLILALLLPVNAWSNDPNYDSATRIVTFPRVTIDNDTAYTNLQLLLPPHDAWKILTATPENTGVTQSLNPFEEIRLSVDLSQFNGRAEYDLSPSAKNELTLESSGLTITKVTLDNNLLPFSIYNGDLQLRLLEAARHLVVDYTFALAAPFQGLFNNGAVTFTWPDFCRNLFPCLSSPEFGTRNQLQLTGIADGKTAVYPTQLSAKAPAYQLAWAVGDYVYQQLGITDAGTRVSLWTLANHSVAISTGLAKLPWVINWLEKTLGPYPFGDNVASVEVDWSNNNATGMEHHPYWHIETTAFDNPRIHIHEAIHGWFGNGIRIACWEDFVFLEGLASYLTAVAAGAIYGAEEEASIWLNYETLLHSAIQRHNPIVWPEGCGQVNVSEIFTITTYMKGAFFFRALEQKVGRETLLAALSVFYRQHQGEAVTFGQLLDTLKQHTQFDPWPLAQAWLRSVHCPVVRLKLLAHSNGSCEY